MLKTRVIPCLLLKGKGLVKTVCFDRPTYVGDPINAVKIFNDKEVDELVFLDIEASKKSEGPNFALLKDITNECFMPLGYGGGVRTLDQIQELQKIGIEKVIINTAIHDDSDFVRQAVKVFGSSSIVASMDVKQNFWGKQAVYIKGGSQNSKRSPQDYAKIIEDLGAGELLLNSIDADGTMKGYDLPLIEQISQAVSMPVVACGGAGTLQHFQQAKQAGASAVAAGSMFVFQGPHRAVLISYPSQGELERALS